MTELRKTPKKAPPPPSAQLRQIQISMTFESSRLLGLSEAERMKVLAHLANLLLLATDGGAAKENGDER
jgi:hypothetical protein